MNNPDEIFIIFISKYSNSCNMISNQIKQIYPYFNTKIIDIDNPVIRSSIYNSTINTVKTVPSIMLFLPLQNKLKVYEGEDVLTMLNQASQMIDEQLKKNNQNEYDEKMRQYEIEQNNRSKIEQFNQQQMMHQQTNQHPSNPSTDKFSSLDSVLDGGDEDLTDQPPPPKNTRRKIQKGVYSDTKFSPIDEEANMITSIKPRPVKGEGHETMARSTLSEFNTEEETVKKPSQIMGPDFEKRPHKKVQIKPGKTVHIIEDIDEDDLDNEDNNEPLQKPTGMSIEDILGEGGASKAPRENKEVSVKSASVKNAAEALLKERNSMDEKSNRKKN